jgi:hypothetical protein
MIIMRTSQAAAPNADRAKKTGCSTAVISLVKMRLASVKRRSLVQISYLNELLKFSRHQFCQTETPTRFSR